MNRRGLSLVSFLVFVIIGFLILGSLYYILHKGMRLQDSTSKAIDMMIQGRAVLENLRHDVEGAILFLPSEEQGGNNKELIIIKDPADVAVERFNLSANDVATTPYPFPSPDDLTEYQMPAIQVKYLYNADERTVVRIQEYGILRYGDDVALQAIVCKYEFQSTSDPAPITKVLGRDITRFDFSHVTMDRAGKPLLIEELEPADFYLEDWNGFRPYLTYSQTALLYSPYCQV